MTGRRPPAAVAVLALAVLASGGAPAAQQPGLTAAPAVSAVYDLILDAGFDAAIARLPTTCGPAPPEVCATLAAAVLQWKMLLDPSDRSLDAPLARRVEDAIARTTAWTEREPDRAEAWFYLGAAHGVRVQARVLRRERLPAAQDGKRIKEAMERALDLDPGLYDARFGLGMYHYYADVAPAVLRWLRWLFLLPGGDRDEGLREIQSARELGVLVGGEATYQLHLIYLWYENRPDDALALVRELARRYPGNALFHSIEATVLDEYFDDAAASLAASERLRAQARDGTVRHAAMADVTARLNIALQLDHLGRTAEARAMLQAIIAEHPASPVDAALRATRLLNAIDRR